VRRYLILSTKEQFVLVSAGHNMKSISFVLDS